MLYRDIARLGILSFKLHVNAIQSPVHYYQIIKKTLCRDGNRTDDVLFQFLFHDLPDYKKNFIVATGIESMTYYFSFFSMIYSTYVSHLNLVQMFHVLCY